MCVSGSSYCEKRPHLRVGFHSLYKSTMRNKWIAPVVLLFLLQSVPAQDKPAIREIDRIRLAEAFRLGESIANDLWKGWDKTPFAVLLVTPEVEFLIRHPQPSEDFTKLGYDALLKSEVYFRKRTQQTSLLATFPAIQGSMISTIVVGQAENTTAKTSTPWVITLLHEHFHQMQDSQPNFYQDVNALNLAHGDQTGMWMLNYAFPYDKKEVQEKYAALSKLLAEILVAKDKTERSRKITAYFQARREFQQMLAADDYKYFAFELWKEGIARYTEYHAAKLAAAKYRPSKEFEALKDFISFEQAANSIRERIVKQLLTDQLGEIQREVVYPFGAAEGLLLDEVNPSWRSRYFAEKFDLGRYFDKAK